MAKIEKKNDNPGPRFLILEAKRKSDRPPYTLVSASVTLSHWPPVVTNPALMILNYDYEDSTQRNILLFTVQVHKKRFLIKKRVCVFCRDDGLFSFYLYCTCIEVLIYRTGQLGG